MLENLSQSKSKGRFRRLKWVAVLAVLTAAVIVGYQLWHFGINFEVALNYAALGLLVFVFVTMFYGVIAIHDVPYEIARARNHPHQDAIHAAGWVSLFTLHAIWPFLWIWAMIYRPERGWGFKQPDIDSTVHSGRVNELLRRIEVLENQQRVAKADNLDRHASNPH